MKPGDKHHWGYRTKKIITRGNNILIYQVKHRRGKKAPKGSGFPIGGKLDWGINGTQTYRKIGKNKYLITIKGSKKQMGYTRKSYQRYIR